MRKKLKLHLGCGPEKMRGWVNCDISPEVQPDKIVDLEKKLPFEDDSVEKIYANMVFEHIKDLVNAIHEIHRICCEGAEIIIRVPFFSSWHNATDPTHVRTFNHRTLNYFNGSWEVGSTGKMFDINSEIIFGVGKFGRYINWFFYPLVNSSLFAKDFYCRFFAYIFPAMEVRYNLIVRKTFD